MQMTREYLRLSISKRNKMTTNEGIGEDDLDHVLRSFVRSFVRLSSRLSSPTTQYSSMSVFMPIVAVDRYLECEERIQLHSIARTI